MKGSSPSGKQTKPGLLAPVFCVFPYQRGYTDPLFNVPNKKALVC